MQNCHQASHNTPAPTLNECGANDTTNKVRTYTKIHPADVPAVTPCYKLVAQPSSAQSSLRRLKLLMVDDDQELTRRLSAFFDREGYQLIAAANVIEMRRVLNSQAIELIILDVNLPGANGFAICRTLRAESLDLPILMLTSRSDVNDRIKGLDVGADDYLVKPFDPGELTARIKAIFRRNPLIADEWHCRPETYRFGCFELNRIKMVLCQNGEPLPVSHDELALLLLLARHPGTPITRDQIALRLKGAERSHDERSIDMLVSRLRKRLQEDPLNPRFLRTVRGIGYMLVLEG